MPSTLNMPESMVPGPLSDLTAVHPGELQVTDTTQAVDINAVDVLSSMDPEMAIVPRVIIMFLK